MLFPLILLIRNFFSISLSFVSHTRIYIHTYVRRKVGRQMAFGQWKRVLRRDRWNEPKGKNRSRVEKEGGGREEHPRRYSRSLRLRKSTENKDLNPEVGNRDRLLLFIEFHRLRSSKNRSKNHRDTRYIGVQNRQSSIKYQSEKFSSPKLSSLYIYSGDKTFISGCVFRWFTLKRRLYRSK